MEIELIMAMGNKKPNIYAQPCQQFGVSPQPVYFLGLNHFGFPIIILNPSRLSPFLPLTKGRFN